MEYDMESFEVYSKEVNNFRILSREEELSLLKRCKNGDVKARNLLLCSNLKFVIKYARKYSENDIPLEDLISEGNIGLLTAIKKFDIESGFKLITYAKFWIEQSIRRYVQETSRCVKLPANSTKLLKDPRFRSKSIYEKINATDKSALLLDFIEDDKYPTPEKNILDYSDRKQVDSYLKNLTKKERTIIEKRYGLNNQEPKTLNSIGLEFGISREGVRHLETSAIKKLKKIASAS